MNKLIIIFLFLTLFASHSFSQENFTSILDSLSVKRDTVYTGISEDTIVDYFKEMNDNRNFRLKKTDVDREVLFIREYNEFSGFLLFPPDVLRKPSSIFLEEMPQLFLLFDKKKQKCFLFKYNMGLCCSYDNIYKDTSLISARYSKVIGSIIELDSCFNPIQAYIFHHFPNSSKNIKEGDSGSRFKFSHSKTGFQILTCERERFNFKEISYLDFIELFSVNPVPINENQTEETYHKYIFNSQNPFFFVPDHYKKR